MRLSLLVDRQPRRMTVVLIAVVAALAFAGCGVKANDSAAPSSNPTLDAGDRSPSAGSSGSSTATLDPTTTEGRGSSGETTSVPSIPGGSAKLIHDALVQGFKAGGLSDKQAECLADGYEKHGFTDPSGASAKIDYTKILDLLKQCDVSVTDFGNQLPGADGN